MPRSCPLCDAEDATSLRMIDSWHLVACKACDFVYLQNPPAYEALSETFSWDKQIEKARETRRKKHPLLGWFSKHTRWRNRLFARNDMQALIAQYAQPGRIVDIGCGGGDRLLRLPEAYTPFGIEISASLSQQANAALGERGGECWHLSALEGLKQAPAGHFTGATLRSYLEHESQPKEVLHALHQALTPGGIAVIKVPNLSSINHRIMRQDWCGYRFPDHVNYFTPASLRRMLARCGFAIERSNWRDRFPFSDNMWMIARKM